MGSVQWHMAVTGVPRRRRLIQREDGVGVGGTAGRLIELGERERRAVNWYLGRGLINAQP